MPEVIPACLITKFQKNALSVSILMFSSVSSKKDYNISVAVKFTFCNGSYIQICAACSDSTYRSKGFQWRNNAYSKVCTIINDKGSKCSYVVCEYIEISVVFSYIQGIFLYNECSINIICTYLWSHDYWPIRCIENYALNHLIYTLECATDSKCTNKVDEQQNNSYTCPYSCRSASYSSQLIPDTNTPVSLALVLCSYPKRYYLSVTNRSTKTNSHFVQSRNE